MKHFLSSRIFGLVLGLVVNWGPPTNSTDVVGVNGSWHHTCAPFGSGCDLDHNQHRTPLLTGDPRRSARVSV